MARSCTGGGNFPTMAALSEDATADLRRRVAELERQLETAVIERETAVDRQTASAMDNFRLQSELRAALERQGASAEILRAIANTSGDADQALQQIAETTARLFGAPSVTMVLVEGESWGKTINYGASSERVRARVAVERPRFGGDNLPGTVLRENRQIHIPDLDHIDPGMAHWPVMAARAEGTRTVAATPLRHEARPIGVLIVYRGGLAPFTDGELALQQTFADQAVIAIENARLFNESQEALSRQTATSDILRVISRSPTDVQPVFDAIVQTAVRLLQCDRAFVMRCEGTRYVTVATAALDGSFDELGYAAPIDPAANFPSRAILEKQTLYYPDWSVIELPDREKHLRETYGINCSLFLPLLRDQECIGLLALVSKHSAMFGDSEIALAEDLRRSGRDRDRECAAVQRDPGGAGPADRHLRHAARHQPVADRRAAGIRRHRADRRAPARLRDVLHPALRRRPFLECGQVRAGRSAPARPSPAHTGRSRRQFSLARHRGQEDTASAGLVRYRAARIRARASRRRWATIRRLSAAVARRRVHRRARRRRIAALHVRRRRDRPGRNPSATRP